MDSRFFMIPETLPLAGMKRQDKSPVFPVISGICYVDGKTSVPQNLQDGSLYAPYETFQQALDAHGDETHIRVVLKNTDAQDIVLDGRDSWTVDAGLATKDGSRVNVNSITVTGNSDSCYLVGLVINTTLTTGQGTDGVYVRYCSIKGETLNQSNSYTCYESCSFMGNFSGTGGGTVDMLSCQFEKEAVLSIAGGLAFIANSRDVSLDVTGGAYVYATGGNNFMESQAMDGYAIRSDAGSTVVLAGGMVTNVYGDPGRVSLEGNYSLGTLIHNRGGSTLTGNNFRYLMYADQIIYDDTRTVKDVLDALLGGV